MEYSAQLAVLLVLLGCCSNVIFLELLVKQDPGIGNLVTASQFIVIALEVPSPVPYCPFTRHDPRP